MIMTDGRPDLKSLAKNGPEISLPNQNRPFKIEKSFSSKKHQSRTVNIHPNTMIYQQKPHTITSLVRHCYKSSRMSHGMT